MTYSAATTVVALMRDMPKTLTAADLGDALLDNGSVDQVWMSTWAAHRDRTVAPPGDWSA
ncbi:hypothetical protein [Mycolicibacterium mageritense]|uniref:Uncharacterized protein n=1 Tax=Mycolicibacterium mageritense TaxID=53462 RepID=A0ABM7I580_MYCME|nr:hypothetical protein [Mycolicibacterium mageritense]MCC9184124.1 hypothetical protein [Mycolicibacterium mageritense]BBX38054.1 hypothetical protein MMAGJ_73360 [Mycolicibacterium mageritense]CDO27210.1 hypothetical protein BN978_07776 [Mycolicibacterium mageritense DSM 44476 = CIP 104973]